MALNIDVMGLRGLESKPRPERLLGAALLYARNGARVIPLFPNTKMPAVESWSDASNDPGQIREWFGPGGKHCNGNLAIYIDGFKVIDIDRHGDADGFKTLNGALEKVVCPRAITAGKGEHLLATKTDVKHDPGNGVEVLEEGHLFTVYPSEIDGNRYLWRTGGVPCPVQRIRGVPEMPVSPSAVAVAPAGYLRELLEHIDPDLDYGTWLKVGMAIHHNDAGEAGLSVWNEWSAGGRKFKAGECERRWDTFDANRGKPTTLRWLIIQAIKNGKPTTKEDILYHGNLFNSLEIEKVNEKYGLFDMRGKLYIVYKEQGHISMADPFNFKVKIADQKVEHDGKLKPMADVWLEHPDRRIVTEIGMWMPGTEPPGAMNSYEGLAVEPVECEEEEISLYLNFLRNDICRGNEAYYDFLLDLLSEKLKHPLKLMKICLVLRGGEGAGKGAVTRVMENIIGSKHAVNISSAKSWLGAFSGSFISGAIWLSANEAYWSGNHEQSERLKALVSEENIDLEDKFVKGWMQKNRLMVAITSNNKWAVPAGHDSRRYFVLDVSDSRTRDSEFWDEFWALMGADQETGKLNNPEYLGKILYFMLNRKRKNQIKWAMETHWLQAQRRESAIESREDAFILWVRQSFTGDLQNDVIMAAGGTGLMVVEKRDGSKAFRSDRVYFDYRDWVTKHYKRPRMVFDQGSFTKNMESIGLVSVRVDKDRLTAGGRKLPDATGNGAKTTVTALPSSDQIEAAINKNFSLFGLENIGEDEE